MKVWVVEGYYMYEGGLWLAVFSTEEKATEFVKNAREKYHFTEYYIEEVEVDVPPSDVEC